MLKGTRKFLSSIGRMGGKKKSDKKKEAVLKNLEKAWAASKAKKLRDPFTLPPLPVGWDTKISNEPDPKKSTDIGNPGNENPRE